MISILFAATAHVGTAKLYKNEEHCCSLDDHCAYSKIVKVV